MTASAWAGAFTIAVALLTAIGAPTAQDGPLGPLRQVFGPPVQTIRQAIQGKGAPSRPGVTADAVAVDPEEPPAETATPADVVDVPEPRPRPPQDAEGADIVTEDAIAATSGPAADAGPDPANFADRFAPEADEPAPVPEGRADPPALLSYGSAEEEVPVPRPRSAAAAATKLASLPPNTPVTPSGEALSGLRALGVVAVSIDPIREGGCGIAAPVAVSALGGGDISLSETAVLDPRAANTLATWMRDEVQPAARQYLGGSVTGIRVAASYHCRGRNGVSGARLSEHAFGRAIDISAFQVAGVGWVEVGRGHGLAQRRFVSAVREAACGPFTTVLGPGSDSYHSDHLHLDVIRRGKSGNGLYCK